ncbi:MAG: PDZ domain-containing protein [Opitutales bacterium]
MKLPSLSHSLLPLALAGAISARADEPKPVPAPADPHQRQITVVVKKDEAHGPKEVVTFLGIETVPADATLASQLGLADGVGLVVRRLVDGSPAQGVLKEHDILTKFEDQILVDQRQLSVLVRSRKAGDEVTLTLYRGGKETTVKAKLATHEVPKLAELDGFGPGDNFRIFHHGLPGMEEMQNLPGMAREDIDRVVRMLGQGQANLMAPPQVRMFAHRPDGATILNLPQGNLAYSDEEGTIEVNAKADGKRELTLKNPKGEVTFKGSVNNEVDRQKLPPEVQARLGKIEKLDVEYETGGDFDQEGAAIGPMRKTRIQYRFHTGEAPPAPSF